jgi:riboflavin synthase
MFTGIVTDVGQVRAVVPANSRRDTRFEIETRYPLQEIPLGASICCSGACMTVVGKGANWFAVDASAETLSRTTLGDWRTGTRVNLERPLRMGDELGGHVVSGHVDGVAAVVERRPESGSLRFVFEVDRDLGRYIAPKGSVAIDGVSLTVNEVEDRADKTRFGVNIIPHTQENTTIGAFQPGMRVNVEVDMLARYVARLNDTRS